jgi:uncharacterized RDD family membrane protein YckC
MNEEMKAYNLEEEPQAEEKEIHIDYKKPVLSKRVFARILDMLFFIAAAVLLFSATKAIVNSTPYYQECQTRVNKTRVDSGLYIYISSDDRYEEIVTYYNSLQPAPTPGTIMSHYEDAIDTFISFSKTNNEEFAIEEQQKYDNYRLNLQKDGVSLFVKNDQEEIVRNDAFQVEGGTYAYYNSNCYEPFIRDQLTSDLVVAFPQYYKDLRFISMSITFIDLPVGVILGALLIYYIPPLIFRRSRQTFGMLIYHIGRTNQQLLHLSFGRYTAYSAIFIFGILILAFATFGITLIANVLMMTLSKNKQDFGEYLLQIFYVDITNEQIYYNLQEVADNYQSNKKISKNFKFLNKP